MIAGHDKRGLKRSFAFLAGVGFAAIPAFGPFLAILAFFTGQLSIQRADLWWWFTGILLCAPFLLTGHTADAALALVQVLAIWLIYRSSMEFRKGLRNDALTRDIGVGLVLGLAITLAFGLVQISQFRFDIARSPLDAIVWNTHPALFGHSMVVLAALLAVVVPNARLRFAALALGAIGVILSGSREAVLAWLLISVGLSLIGHRGSRRTRIAEWILVGIMLVIVSGLGQTFGLGRTGFLTDFAPSSVERNLFRGTEIAAGDWWYPLGVTHIGESVTIDGAARNGLTVTKTWPEPWSRLQQVVTLTPFETYTLSAAVRTESDSRPGFDGWGRTSSDEEATNLATTIDNAALRTTTTGEISIVSSSIVSLEDNWQRIVVTFKYTGATQLTWYVGVVPDRSAKTGTTSTFAELQLIPSYSLLPYRPGLAERGVTELRASRLPIWRDAVAAFQARPVFGWGPAGLPTAVETLHPDEALLRPVAAHAHNIVLSALVEGGAIGALGVLMLFALLGLRAVQQRDRAIAIVLLGIAILNTFDTTLFSAAVIYPLAAVVGWRSVGHGQAANHETGAGSALLTRLALAATDYCVAAIALGVSYLVFTTQTVLDVDLQSVMFLACAWPLVNSTLGQYPGYGRPDWQVLQRTVIGSFGAGVLVLVICSVLEMFQNTTAFLFLATALATLGVPAGRAITKLALQRLRVWGKPIVVVGNNGSGDKILAMLSNQPKLGLHPVALVDENRDADSPIPDGVPWTRRLTTEITKSANHVIVAPGRGTSTVVQEVLDASGRDAFKVVQLIPDLHTVPSTDVIARPLGRSLSLEVRNNLAFSHNRFIKRASDVVAVTLGSVLAAPLIAIIAIAIRLDSRGPAFYKQLRIGRDGKPFYVWKFRSMVADADARLKELLESDASARQEWNETQKLINDPRITRVGNFLRRTSLDELPQLWNVVRGQMSLVGPRPIIEAEVKKYEDRYVYYTQVRPGMTGAWQVSGRSDTTYNQRVELDTYYVRNWNLWIDLDILIKTVGVVLKREGAY